MFLNLQFAIESLGMHAGLTVTKVVFELFVASILIINLFSINSNKGCFWIKLLENDISAISYD